MWRCYLDYGILFADVLRNGVEKFLSLQGCYPTAIATHPSVVEEARRVVQAMGLTCVVHPQRGCLATEVWMRVSENKVEHNADGDNKEV